MWTYTIYNCLLKRMCLMWKKYALLGTQNFEAKVPKWIWYLNKRTWKSFTCNFTMKSSVVDRLRNKILLRKDYCGDCCSVGPCGKSQRLCHIKLKLILYRDRYCTFHDLPCVLLFSYILGFQLCKRIGRDEECNKARIHCFIKKVCLS